MSELACNIAMYRPDPKLLAQDFHPRHVETLLEEAGDLIDRCLDDFRDYSSLNYAWHQFLADLVAEEKDVRLKQRLRESADSSSAGTVPEQPEPEREPPSAEAASTKLEEDTATAAEEGRVEEEKEGAPAGQSPPPAGAGTGLDLRVEALKHRKHLSAPGQPLALNDLRDLALKRLCRDYERSLDRACVVHQGLREIYGHGELPSPLPSEAEPLSASITALALWIRDAREWLARYQRQEQEFTRVVSLRSLLNRSAWTQLKHARDSLSLKLPVPAELFRNHENCRLRGIAASLAGDVGTVQWSMLVRLPEEAVYERSGQSVEVDQSSLPSCLLGRVENRRSVHPLEVCGGSFLINASPLGRPVPGGLWGVEIFRPSGALSESFGHLEDVVLELRCVGIPKLLRRGPV